MKNKLKDLFESSVLNDETKTVIGDAFDTAVSAKEHELKEQYEADLVEAKAELNDTYKQVMEETIAEELEGIAEEVKHARTLEVQYADKLETFKEDYQASVGSTISEEVNTIIKEELDELKEDIEAAKKHQFVFDMFEAYKTTYDQLFGSEDAISVQEQLKEAQEELAKVKAKQKLDELLEGLEGRTREVAKTILESVPYDKMEAKFESVRPVLLSESDEGSEKSDGETITEGTDGSEGSEVNGKVVMENAEQEEKTDPVLLARIQRSLRLAHGK